VNSIWTPTYGSVADGKYTWRYVGLAIEFPAKHTSLILGLKAINTLFGDLYPTIKYGRQYRV